MATSFAVAGENSVADAFQQQADREFGDQAGRDDADQQRGRP